MLFDDRRQPALAISQPAHAWISGQILRAWHEPLDDGLLLAAEQHDIAWLDWETEPAFDPRSGRPFWFRDVGASVHAPMWRRGVQRALAAWGMQSALLISRHGGVIYRRFTDRHRTGQADADAAEAYLREQAPKEAAWAERLGLDERALGRASGLIAFADTLSLVLCGAIEAPQRIQSPDGEVAASAVAGEPAVLTISPWPFTGDRLVVRGEARPLPASGRFESEAAMRDWLRNEVLVGFEITARKLD